jgi:hypothetical protein
MKLIKLRAGSGFLKSHYGSLGPWKNLVHSNFRRYSSKTHELTVSSIRGILIPYHRSLCTHTELVNTLRSHTVSFEASKEAIARWVTQSWLEEDGWEAKWEDLCSVEIERWNK